MRIMTEEHKRKISEALKGRIISPDTLFKKGYIPSHMGKKRPVYIGEKISKALKGRKCPWARNNPQVFKKGTISWNKGLKGYQSGENNSNWKGGITPINFKVRHSEEYMKWRRDVLVRDHFTCQKCGHRFINIVAHHIKYFSEYKELWFDVTNGITLCKNCHCRLHFTKSNSQRR